MSKHHPKSLVRIWSVRYFAFIIAGAAILLAVGVGVFSVTIHTKLHRVMSEIARDIAAEAEAHDGWLPDDRIFDLWLDDRMREFAFSALPTLIILDARGEIVRQYPPPDAATGDPLLGEDLEEHVGEILAPDQHFMTIQASAGRPPLMTAVHPIRFGPSIGGYALFSLPKQHIIPTWTGQNALPFRFSYFVIVLVTSWWIIYFLTRRLVRPIKAAAEAANRIVAGEYDIHLSGDYHEREFRELTAAMSEMAARLQHLESLRNQLVAGVTHELKTPVTSVSGLVQAVRDGIVKPEDTKEYLDACLKEIERLERLIDDLLEYGRFTGAVVTVSNEAIDACAAVREITERWRLSTDLDGRLSIVVEATQGASSRRALVDPIRLEQVLINLLNNAYEAMEGVGRIIITLSQTGDSLHVHVRDTGTGIPPEEQLDVFEPFFRGTGKRIGTPGIGLGLPFSRLIARSTGGDLTLTESGSTGSTFTLSVPAAEASYKQRDLA